ncbi:hypothetical protein AAVH_21348 [Aphelenchoides avenae]|nr:hypothetical protein AAVH_21348 [Aphelenchus avenae]
MNDEGASLEVSIANKKRASPSEYSIVALRTTVSSFEAIAASASNILILEEEPANKTVAKQVLRLLNTHLMSELHVDFEIKVLAAPLPVLMKKVALGMDHKQRLKQERLQLKTAKETIDRLNAQIRAFPPPNDDVLRGDPEDRRVVRSQRSGSVPPRFKPY